MTKQTVKFKPSNFFKDKEEIAELLQDALNSRDPKDIARAIEIAAKAKGIINVALKSNLDRIQQCRRPRINFDNPNLVRAKVKNGKVIVPDSWKEEDDK